MMDEQKPRKHVNFTVVVIAAIVVLGGLGFSYVQSIKEKNTIEREKIESTERLKNEEMKQEQEQAGFKREQEEKEFDAKRKTDCLNIYKAEGAKWNNVTGWRYSDVDDRCYIEYKESTPKSASECDNMWPTRDDKGKMTFTFFHENILCKDGKFENNF